MSDRKVTIDADTARYYLRLEAAFNGLIEGLNIDVNADLGYDQNQRYMHRTDLHDNWSRAVAKKEVKYVKGGRRIEVKEIF